MTQIQIIIDDTQLQGGISQFTAKLADLSPAMKDIGESALRKVRRRFDTETGVDGQRWNELADSTIKAKAKRKRTGRPYRTNAEPSAILKDTFTLRDSIAYQVTNSSVAIGTNIFYGTFNQNTRPFLGVDDEDAIEIVEIIKEYLES
ncbi:MAG: phage virion morphogenesis protein [Chroococcidiopsis sp.]